jgi:hypothetical protein
MKVEDYLTSRLASLRQGARAIHDACFKTPSALTRTFLVLGLVLRIAEYLLNRGVWLDESYLIDGIAGWPILDLHPLPHGQLAPPGFLVVQRTIDHLIGHSLPAMRLFPMLCGLASVVWLARLAPRVVSATAVPIALALFALSSDHLYYSCEVKQYSCDMALGLACLLLPSWLASEWATAARFVGAAVFGVVATWLSNPSVFFLATAGSYLFVEALARRDWARAVVVALMGVVWVLSFTASFFVSQAIIRPDTILWKWWAFSFLPLPPRSVTDLTRLGRHILNMFINPVALETPLGPMATSGLGLMLAVVGGWAIGRRNLGSLYLLLAPLLAAMAAAGAGKYPFHGRVIVFLVPVVLLLVAEGAAVFGRITGRRALIGLMIFLLVYPVLGVNDQIGRSRPRPFDPHADLRADIFTTSQFCGEPEPPSLDTGSASRRR